ncbi:uncharacterized protein L969DRAFT_324891 [Mixia osmundae IAM 14324]|uniref:Uncharacterized protein n=1 Tax=Mixia osmundae (strain CBS 9802 / IAM 14324 / JCM 22182 / KY 12970) TaxID=764103 RepID=G7DTU2_MIXOS|nr:uncharacterized protein L969DRAFT_324891 [Mixia osmundae IAM 14324]KEI41716.1 hypothetical protein L969DRAFT_324891 [Mixia osmundae IAM 14324]GAA94002.1 hypothetical protein E5Q_00649 [Mixia osmundae IAM 14324]
MYEKRPLYDHNPLAGYLRSERRERPSPSGRTSIIATSRGTRAECLKSTQFRGSSVRRTHFLQTSQSKHLIMKVILAMLAIASIASSTPLTTAVLSARANLGCFLRWTVNFGGSTVCSPAKFSVVNSLAPTSKSLAFNLRTAYISGPVPAAFDLAGSDAAVQVISYTNAQSFDGCSELTIASYTIYVKQALAGPSGHCCSSFVGFNVDLVGDGEDGPVADKPYNINVATECDTARCPSWAGSRPHCPLGGLTIDVVAPM